MDDDEVLVGIDFTADRLRVLLADVEGEPVHEGEWALPDLPDEAAWSWEVGGRVATLFAEEGNGRSALAIAVAAPGAVNPVTGRLERSLGQPGWDGLAVVEALRRHIDAPIAAESRVRAALLGEAWQGAAAGLDDVLYVSLRGTPEAAILSGGRALRGARFRAGALPAFPELPPVANPPTDPIEQTAGLLADAAALVDPQTLVLYGLPQHLDVLVPLTQRVLTEVAPGISVTRASLGHRAALIGAIRIASTLAYEGHRKP
ncbi:MAG: ROK family protein [Dehalococcoidia bacterium]